MYQPAGAPGIEQARIESRDGLIREPLAALGGEEIRRVPRGSYLLRIRNDGGAEWTYPVEAFGDEARVDVPAR